MGNIIETGLLSNDEFEFDHQPVMKSEAIHYLDCSPGKIYVDCTIGGGGHSQAILEKIAPDGILIGIDQDQKAIEYVSKKLERFSSQLRLFNANFIQIKEILSESNISFVDGILTDLGVSTYQIKQSGRGFSFANDEPLDMRMNPNQELTAYDLINDSDQKALADIFYEYGEERYSKQIAAAIIKHRKHEVIKSTLTLANIITNTIPKKAQYKERINPATRVFMALRIAVNNELENLKNFMDDAINCLNPKGRLCVISFHSLEDRIVKQHGRSWEKPCTCPPGFPKCVCNKVPIAQCLNRKPILPSPEEIESNPRSRSAKLRAIEKI